MSGAAEDTPRTAYDRLGRACVYLVVIVGGWLLATRLVEPQAEHDPTATFEAVVGVALVAVGVFYGQSWYAWRQRGKRVRERALAGGPAPPWPDPNRGWVKFAFIVGAIVVYFGLQSGKNAREYEITYYCSYGAVSESQLAGCEDKVSSRYIKSLDTDAARFAKGQLESCLQDAGPYCEQERRYKSENEEAAGAGE